MALGAVLVVESDGTRARIAAAIFATAMSAMFGTSALYHRITWSPGKRRWMRRADHATIYLLIAGTYTPFGLLVLSGAWRITILAVVWSGALLAIVLKLFWTDAPRWVAVACAIGLGWAGIAAFPQMLKIGVIGVLLLVGGGLLYTLGALVYARERPDPAPTVFGYHEIFHAFVIAAAACQYVAVAFFILR